MMNDQRTWIWDMVDGDGCSRDGASDEALHTLAESATLAWILTHG